MAWWALIFAAVFLIGLTKSGFGGGMGLMAVPMTLLGMSHLPYGEKAALGFMLPLLIVGDLLAVWHYRRLFSLRIVGRLLLPTGLGVVAASLLLGWIASVGKQAPLLANALMRMEIGIESIVLVALHWWRLWRGGEEKPWMFPEPWRTGLAGSFAGVSSTMAHAAGPIIALYLLPLKLERRLFVGTCAIYFFLLNSAKVPGYIQAGQFQAQPLTLAAWCLPLVLAGALTGRWLTQRMSDALFSRITYTVTFVLGWYLLADGSWKAARCWAM